MSKRVILVVSVLLVLAAVAGGLALNAAWRGTNDAARAAGAPADPFAASVRAIGDLANEKAAAVVRSHPEMNLPEAALTLDLDDPNADLATAGAGFAASAEALDAAIPAFAAAEAELVAAAPGILDANGVDEPERGRFLAALRNRQNQGSDTIAYFTAIRDRNQAMADLLAAMRTDAGDVAALREAVALAERRMGEAQERMAKGAERLRAMAEEG